MNSVHLIGRLTKDIEIVQTQSGTDIANFTLAINRNKEETDFIRCVAFNKTAEVLNNYTSKGSQIGVEGSIRVENFEDKEGNKRTAVKVNAYRIELLDSKSDNKQKQKPQEQEMKDIDIGEDSLPF